MLERTQLAFVAFYLIDKNYHNLKVYFKQTRIFFKLSKSNLALLFNKILFKANNLHMKNKKIFLSL